MRNVWSSERYSILSSKKYAEAFGSRITDGTYTYRKFNILVSDSSSVHMYMYVANVLFNDENRQFFFKTSPEMHIESYYLIEIWIFNSHYLVNDKRGLQATDAYKLQFLEYFLCLTNERQFMN